MPININTQATTAFKHLLGKSNTDVTKGVLNEADAIAQNVHGSYVWMDSINSDPAQAVIDGIAVEVVCDMVLDGTSNGHALFATWPATPPSGTDPVTNLAYAYGSGSLAGVTPGDRVTGAIPDSFGIGYLAQPKDGVNAIPVGDQRDWIYQYNSGIFFQESGSAESWGGSAYGHPTTITLYVYIGDTVLDITGAEDLPNVVVTATYITTGGSPVADEFNGASVPTQVVYDQSVIYLVTFDQNNTGPVRLDIDGLGQLEILKGDEVDGLVSLEANDLIAAVVYYVIYDGTQFQVFETEPTAAPGTYTNLNPATTTVGGITAGTIFNNITYSNLFDMMFYPYLLSNFTSFSISGQASTLEVGQPITAGSKTFLWNTSNSANVTVNTVKIQQITTSTTWLATGLANDSSESIVFGSPIVRTTAGTYSWKIYAQRTVGTWFNSTFAVAWRWRRFYGTSANTSLTEAQIEALANQGLATGLAGTYSLAAGNYKYFAFPTAFGEATLFKDTSTNLAVAMAGPSEGYTSGGTGGLYYQLVSVTNGFGVTTNYRVYRTMNILGGSISIIVS